MKYIVRISGKTFKVNPIQVVEANSKEEALKSVQNLEGVEKNSKYVYHEPIIQEGTEIKDENFHIVEWKWAAIREVLSVYANSEKEARIVATNYMDNHREYSKYAKYSSPRTVYIAENSGVYYEFGSHWCIHTKSPKD